VKEEIKKCFLTTGVEIRNHLHSTGDPTSKQNVRAKNKNENMPPTLKMTNI
jgi:hypothetical protein